MISAREAGRLWPLMRTDDLVGAVWIPRDGRTNPIDTTLALARGARQGGAALVENVTVTAIRRANGGRHRGRHGSRRHHVRRGGELRGDVGARGRPHGRRQRAAARLRALLHRHRADGGRGARAARAPRHRRRIYVREEVGGLLMGGFEPVAKPWGMAGIPPDFKFSLLPEDWEHFRVFMEPRSCASPRWRRRRCGGT